MNHKKDLIKSKKKGKILFKKKEFSIYLIKTILIIFLIYGLFFSSGKQFSNSIGLLAVNEDNNGDVNGGSLIDLNLKIKKGSGQIFINLDNSIKDIDTQISIINSQKISCELFMLDCSKYNFYYDFEGGALLLKGPSASSAIAILTAKTLNKEKINKNEVIITGTLNSGGIIGAVGGIDEKIKTAQDLGFKKVLIPIFSDYNKTIKRNIKVIEILDLVEAYNNFNGEKYILKSENLNNQAYKSLMKTLSNDLCQRSEFLSNKINLNITKNDSKFNYLNQALKSINSSNQAFLNENYYSRGSFCYSANINYRILNELENNLSNKERKNEISILEKEINSKLTRLNSKKYKENITTINDFYVYLLLNNRIDEAKDFLKSAKNATIIPQKEIIKDIILSNSSSKKIENITNISLKQKPNIIDDDIYFSYAKERFYTVGLWEKFIEHTGTKIKFNDETISNACLRINRELSIKNELLTKYGVLVFKDILEKQSKLQYLGLNNEYLCIYNGIENLGKMNTILNSVGIKQNDTKTYAKNLIKFTKTRISLNSNGDFPLIPYIYLEYATDLFEQDSNSAILYSNYALAYADLNLFLKNEKSLTSYVNYIEEKLFENPLFVFSLLLILVFLN